MSPPAILFNIAVVVAMVGIVLYWMRRFAVFRGYKDVQGAAQQIASALKAQPAREDNDLVVAGHYRGRPTIVRLSHRVDTPGLYIEMRAPATCDLSLMPRLVSRGHGRVVLRTGSPRLEKKFIARTDHPGEMQLLLQSRGMVAALEQLCCSSQTAFSLKSRAMELAELTIPESILSHVTDHLDAMAAIGDQVEGMPGTDQVKIEPLPRRSSSWIIRATLVGGLICMITLLFVQPYNRQAVSAGATPVASGMLPADAVRVQKLEGWHVASAEDFSGAALRFLRDHGLPQTGRVAANFGGAGTPRDSAYLLLDHAGRRRVILFSGGRVAYDAIFPRADLLVAVPRGNLAAIQWKSAPPLTADGDALLVIQNADDPAASLVLLTRNGKISSARPADFNKVELAAR
jgi:hypothetical protein